MFTQTLLWHMGIAAILLTGCKTPPTSAQKHQQIANACCECAASLPILDKAAQTLSDSTAAFSAHLAQMQLEFDKSFQCLTPLLNELGSVPPQELPQIQDAMRQSCPELANNKELLTELLCR